ncbi:MAG: bifunctional riboflavin kinase/FAD synthetase [Flavobacteriaceae bacterium]|nr:bifunctional riboflavin kinase/FAD synthetase [Flavobacteriaceae bacterium]
MEVVQYNKDYKLNFQSVVTIGAFDGVHVGHQEILQNLVKTAKNEDKKSVVVTFFPHPRMVLEKNTAIKLLNTLEEKTSLIEAIGIDFLYVIPFNEEFANLSANDFISEILVKQLNTKALYIGYDHLFGKNRAGNFKLLKEQGDIYNFSVNEIGALSIREIKISSTKIRTALIEGDILKANEFLGYYYFLSGTVVKGKNIGEKIGFPTANIKVKESYKLIPKNGVYVVKSFIENQTIYGMMNIGNRPTVNGKNQTIEVHFFNFNQYIYNTEIKVQFLSRLRDEQKFESLDALKNQLKIDQINAEDFIKNNQEYNR